MISPDVKTAIEKVLHERLDRIGFIHADIRESTDHDGDAILQIVLHYRRMGDSVDPLRSLGESRFPHFTHRFPDDQELKVA